MAKKFEFLEVFMGIVLLSFVSANAAVISDVKVCNLMRREGCDDYVAYRRCGNRGR